eukprot:sb/3479191/
MLTGKYPRSLSVIRKWIKIDTEVKSIIWLPRWGEISGKPDYRFDFSVNFDSLPVDRQTSRVFSSILGSICSLFSCALIHWTDLQFTSHLFPEAAN